MVPSSTVQLSLGSAGVQTVVSIPVSDIESATGLDFGDESQADVAAQQPVNSSYLLAHFPPSDAGTAWTVAMAGFSVAATGDASTGNYQMLTTTFTLTPAAGKSLTSFNLGYDAILDKAATNTVIVTASADDSITSVGVGRT